MDLEQLRRAWQSTQVDNRRLAEENRRLLRSLASGRITGSQRKLRNDYIRVAILGLLLPILAPSLVYILALPLWCAVVYALFGIFMATLNGLFAFWIDDLDLMSMPVTEALSRAVDILRRQRQLHMCGIICGGAVVGSIAVCAIDVAEYYMIVGFIVGLGVGLVIGLLKYRRQRRLARSIRDELRGLQDAIEREE